MYPRGKAKDAVAAIDHADHTAPASALRSKLTQPRRGDHRHRWLWPVGWLVAVLCMSGLGAYHLLVYAPHLDRPHHLAVLDRLFGVGVVATVLFCGLLIGRRCLGWLRLADAFEPVVSLALATGLGLGALSLGTLILGFLQLYYGVTFAVLLAGLPWLLVGERWWVGTQMGRCASWGRTHLHRSRLAPFENVEVVPRLLLAAVVLWVAALTLKNDATMPSNHLGYDTYQYHWSVPLLLLRTHGWVAFPGWVHANLPFGTEMLSLIALSLQAPQAATMIQDAFGLLTALLLFGVVRRQVGSTAAWIVVAVACTIPLLLAYTTQGYVETALVFYGVAALVTVLFWMERISSGDSLDFRLLGLAGIFLGLALGVKYTALEYLPAVGLLALAGLARHTWLRWGQTGPHRFAGQVGGATAMLAGGMLLAFAPWLLKDWALLGNPVYPALAQVFGATEWDTARGQMLAATFAHFGPHAGIVARWHLFALDLFLHPDRYGEGTWYSAGSIAFAAAIGVPAAAYVLWRARKAGRFAAEWRPALLVAALGVCGAAALLVWNFSGALVERYALPGVMLVTLAGATFIGWILSRVPRRFFLATWAITGVLAAICLVQTCTFYAETANERNPLPVLSGQMSEQAFQRKWGPEGLPADFFEAVDYVNQRLPHDGKLLMIGRGTGYFFTDRDYVADSGGDWVPYIVTEGKTPDAMVRLLRAAGFTYVLYDAQLESWIMQHYQNGLLAVDLPTYLAFQRERLILIGQWGNLSLYRVPPA